MELHTGTYLTMNEAFVAKLSECNCPLVQGVELGSHDSSGRKADREALYSSNNRWRVERMDERGGNRASDD